VGTDGLSFETQGVQMQTLRQDVANLVCLHDVPLMNYGAAFYVHQL